MSLPDGPCLSSGERCAGASGGPPHRPRPRTIHFYSRGHQLREFYRIPLNPDGSSSLEIRRRTRYYFNEALRHLPTTSFRTRRQALSIARYDVRKLVLASLLQDGTILPRLSYGEDA